ncbi:MAG: hypothetical protein H6839_02915 [Planctomycetes bacterium]|nr:hypothetical protein [Planctomycetota bacterium]
MGRVTQVINRNGEIVPFRRNRIVRAILAAVRSAGSKDEWIADKLADMVVYFLDMQHGDATEPPHAGDVDDMIEKALLSSPDLHAIAQAFLAGRQQRQEIRELEETIAAEPAAGPQVAQPDQGLGGWNRARIAAAVMRELKLDAATAGDVAQTVEQKVVELDLPTVTTGLIRELVDVELLSRGLIREPGSVSIPRYDLEQWVFPGEETDAPPVGEQAELSERASRRVLSQYSLHSILPADAREAHVSGRLHFEALHAPAAVADTRLDVGALFSAGAGFGLQRMFAESTAGVGAALARLATTIRAAAGFTSGPVALRGLDRALAQQAQDEPDRIERAELQDGLRLLAAQAPAGLLLEVGPPGTPARDMVVRTLIDTLAAADGSLRGQVRLELSANAGAFADPARRSLLERAASAASFCGVPDFRLREPLPERPAGLFGESAGLAHDVVIARAAINLVRPLLKAPDLNTYLERLDPAVELAAQGLAARARYLERVAMRDMPEPVAASSRMLRALVGASRAVELAPMGLGMTAALLAGADSEADPAAQRIAQQILSYLGFKFRERASRLGLNGRLGVRLEDQVATRFAREDVALVAKDDPESALRLRLSREDAYRPGAALDDSLTLSDRLECESALHSLLGRDATVASGRAESLTAAEVLEFVRDCVSERGPQPSKLSVVVSSRTCRDCGARYPANRDSCPVCGSTAWAVPPGQKSLFQ